MKSNMNIDTDDLNFKTDEPETLQECDKMNTTASSSPKKKFMIITEVELEGVITDESSNSNPNLQLFINGRNLRLAKTSKNTGLIASKIPSFQSSNRSETDHSKGRKQTRFLNRRLSQRSAKYLTKTS